MANNKANLVPNRARGFSLIETLMAVAIVSVVIGVVMQGIVQMQKRNTAENAKVDTAQETRDFIDQMVRDIHNVGYPPPIVRNGAPSCVGNALSPQISCGLIFFSPTQIKYEADLDGTGTVYQVWMQLQPGANGNCPCTLQRGAITKTDAIGGAQPTYFTEVDGVLNSGNGAGAATYTVSLTGTGSYTAYSTADVFTAYDINAATVAACNEVATPGSCSSIHSLQITANVAPRYQDLQTRNFAVFSITSKARMNNNNPIN